MREIKTHRCGPLDELLKIEVADDADKKGLNHKYQFYYKAFGNWETSKSRIEFQNCPLSETSPNPNGLSLEAVLAVVIDRLAAYQRTDMACRENAIALTKLEEATHWLKHRTADRMARGVEGTMEK